MKELIEKFEKETGLEFYTVSLDKGEDLYSYDFVNWLIEQLPIHDVVGRSEQLPDANKRQCNCSNTKDRLDCGFECYNK